MCMRIIAVAIVLAACCVACGSADDVSAPVESLPPASSNLTTLPIASTTVDLATQIRVEIAGGCPTTVADHPDTSNTAAMWIANPDPAGLDGTFVAGVPTAALICRYAALNTTTVAADGRQLESGTLFTSTTLDANAAATLATNLNDIVPWDFVSGCLAGMQSARYTAIVFVIPGRSDVDLWLKDWIGCPEVGNGSRTSGLLVNGQGAAFLAQLDTDAPPAPPEDFPSAS